MGKKVLTSNGGIIDLDRESVESIPADSLMLEKHSYGYYDPSSFSLVFNGRMTTIKKGKGQFFDEPEGERRLLTEIQSMKKFPRVFPVSLDQNYHTGGVYYTIYLTIKGVSHKLVLTYDEDHPEYQINAVIEYPRLDSSRMSGHWYGVGKPCYIQNWNRSWTALKVATQMRFWLEDYYGNYTNNSYDNDEFDRVFGKTNRVWEEMKKSQNPWRLF